MNSKPRRSRAQAHLVARLKAARVTYNDVARLAGVSWRMVKHVIDGDRTSANVMRAIDRLAPDQPPARRVVARIKTPTGPVVVAGHVVADGRQ